MRRWAQSSQRSTWPPNATVRQRRAVCGPIRITAPAGGQPLQYGTLFNVQWNLEYPSTIVQNVRVSFIDRANGNVLAEFPSLPAISGQQQVMVPNQATAQAFVRVRAVEKNLRADSDLFEIA